MCMGPVIAAPQSIENLLRIYSQSFVKYVSAPCRNNMTQVQCPESSLHSVGLLAKFQKWEHGFKEKVQTAHGWESVCNSEGTENFLDWFFFIVNCLFVFCIVSF